jgi:two-component system chemotaxis sensor kinase CheA
VTEAGAELLQIFAEETNERLDRIVATLLAVEAGTAAADAVASLFRDAHSIKGNAGMVGFDEAQRIAHAMEDVLESARTSGSLEPELISPLLEATDAIRRVVSGETGVAGKPVAALAPAADDLLGHAAASPPVGGNGAPSSPAAPAGDGPRSIRVPAGKVDRLLDAVGEALLHRRRLDHLIARDASEVDERVDDELRHGDRLLGDMQHAAVELRTLPLSSITGTFPRAVRDVAAAEGKEVALRMTGTDTQLDRVILDGVSETIVHCLRNSVSHGIETIEQRAAAGKPPAGTVELRAEPRGGLVAVTIADDGRGVSPELLRRARERGSLTDVLAEPGFSTAGSVSELSGRGVGLDAVKRHVESLGGTLEIRSKPGHGTEVILLLPMTLAMLHLLLVERGGQVLGLPMSSVVEALTADTVTRLAGQKALELRGGSVPMADVADIIGLDAPGLESAPPAVIVDASGRRVAATCDRILGDQEAVVKGLGPMLTDVPGYLGATILADGRIALILDPAYVARGASRDRGRGRDEADHRPPAKVLVVDDQFTVRELQRSILETAGYRIATARNGREALESLEREGDVELVVTDIEMPEMDGLALLRQIRGRAEPSLPVVVVSSRGGDEDRRCGVEAGADAYVVKSEFNQQLLLDTVRRLVEPR